MYVLLEKLGFKTSFSSQPRLITRSPRIIKCVLITLFFPPRRCCNCFLFMLFLLFVFIIFNIFLEQYNGKENQDKGDRGVRIPLTFGSNLKNMR